MELVHSQQFITHNSQARSSDPLLRVMEPLLIHMQQELSVICGLRLLNPLLELNYEIGERGLFNEKFALHDLQRWQGEFETSSHRDLSRNELCQLTDILYSHSDSINSGLKNFITEYEDLTSRSLLHPEPAIVENLCHREGRLCFRHGKSFSLIFISSDHYIDTLIKYGEYLASSLLAEFSGIISQNIRDYDFFLRYSHNEFCILLHQVDQTQATQLAKRLSHALSTRYFLINDLPVPVSASIGVTEVTPQQTVERTIEIGRHAMHLANKRGGNQFVYSNGNFLYQRSTD